jgi:hypothetical protein
MSCSRSERGEAGDGLILWQHIDLTDVIATLAGADLGGIGAVEEGFHPGWTLDAGREPVPGSLLALAGKRQPCGAKGGSRRTLPGPFEI